MSIPCIYYTTSMYTSFLDSWYLLINYFNCSSNQTNLQINLMVIVQPVNHIDFGENVRISRD